MRVARPLTLSAPDRLLIEAALASSSTRRHLRRRFTVLLMASEGRQDIDIAAALKVTRQTAARWRQRYLNKGLEAVKRVKAGPGRKPRYPAASLQQALEMLDQRAANGQTPSFPAIARATGMSVTSAWRLWRKRVAQTSNHERSGGMAA